MSNQSGSVSLIRLVLVVVPVVLVALGIQHLLSASVEQGAIQQIESNILSRLLGPTPPGPDKPIAFQDADGDLIADSPADEQCLTPEKLVFSYVATAEPGDAPADWQDVITALSERLGVPAEYVPYSSTQSQLTALASGELHVVGLNTGSVPLAVKAAGFVPVCTFGRADDEFGYKMRIIVPADSTAQTPADLRDRQITFVRPDSNSGCKAAIVLLMDDYQLMPETGYDWAFSLDHDASILGVAAGKIEAAPVASDIFERMAVTGEVDANAVRVVYESERFPPAALGFAHNLAPGWREAIAKTLLEFDWSGTSIDGKYGGAEATKFVPVNFKDDWANIRRVDEAVSKARSQAMQSASLY